MKKLKPLAEEGKINQNASIRDSQVIIINAPIQEVWKVLTRIEDWPKWNPDIRSVEGHHLDVNSEFGWFLNGIHMVSKVRRIDAPELLTWTGRALGIKAIHIWKLEASDQQTIVSTEESVEGLRTLFYNHQSLHSNLRHWLDCLKLKIEQPESY